MIIWVFIHDEILTLHCSIIIAISAFVLKHLDHIIKVVEVFGFYFSMLNITFCDTPVLNINKFKDRQTTFSQLRNTAKCMTFRYLIMRLTCLSLNKT